MMDSIKDSFMVALKKNGFSSNSLDESELQIATDDLIAQKPLVQAYVVDQVRDKMIGGEAAIGVMFSGDAIYVIGENPDLDYVIPEEGTNVWIDGWVIPKNAPNKESTIKVIMGAYKKIKISPRYIFCAVVLIIMCSPPLLYP